MAINETIENGFYRIRNTANTGWRRIALWTRASQVERASGANLEDELAMAYLLGNKTLYVATTGNDTTGTGTVGKPYATINKALSVIPKNLNGYDVTITVANGTYNGDISIVGFHGGIIKFLRSDVATIVINGTIRNIGSSQIYFNNASGSTFTVNKTGSGGIYGKDNSYTRFTGGTYIVNVTGNGVSANEKSRIVFEGSAQVNNANVAVYVSGGSEIKMASLSGTGNNNGLIVDQGVITYGTNTLSATTPTQKLNGGIITNELALTSQLGVLALTSQLGVQVHVGASAPTDTTKLWVW